MGNLSKEKKDKIGKLLIVVGVFILIYAAVRFFNVDYHQFTPTQVRDKILSFGLWAPVIYMVFYIVRPIILFPAGLLTVTGGLAFGPLWGTVYTVIGATLCAAWEFLFARYFGRGVFASFLKGKLAKLDDSIATHGFKTVFIFRLIPNLPYDVQNYSIGLTKVRFRDYFWATFVGIIPGTFAFTYLGYSLTDLKQAWKLLLGILLIVAIVLLQGLWRKRTKDSTP